MSHWKQVWRFARYGLMATGLWGISLLGSCVHEMVNEGEATATVRRQAFFFPIEDERVGFARVPYALNDVKDVIFTETSRGAKIGQADIGWGDYAGKTNIRVYLRSSPQAHRLVLMADGAPQAASLDIDRRTGALAHEDVSRHKRSDDAVLNELGIGDQHFIGNLGRKLVVTKFWVVER